MKFHAHEGEGDSLVLTECTDKDSGAVVHLERVKSGEPLNPGTRLCQVTADETGHVELEAVDVPELAAGGPPMVASKAYRDGWDKIFGSGRKN